MSTEVIILFSGNNFPVLGIFFFLEENKINMLFFKKNESGAEGLSTSCARFSEYIDMGRARLPLM